MTIVIMILKIIIITVKITITESNEKNPFW